MKIQRKARILKVELKDKERLGEEVNLQPSRYAFRGKGMT